MTKKISLDVDSLRVTSFDVLPEAGGTRGTVKGYATLAGCSLSTCPTNAYATSPCDTCVAGSCMDTCGIPKTGYVACYPC